jgi:hypothetical protein
MYCEPTLYPPTEHAVGYAQFKLKTELTYNLVLEVQERTTAGLHKYGGVCESWGVLH